jgi:hypothetical protein
VVEHQQQGKGDDVTFNYVARKGRQQKRSQQHVCQCMLASGDIEEEKLQRGGDESEEGGGNSKKKSRALEN